MHYKPLLAGGVALAWVLLAQPALGATVSVSIRSVLAEVVYEAAVGEINDVSFVEEPDGIYMITDLSAAVTPQAPECMSISPNAVRCEIDPGLEDSASIFTKDGADSVAVDSADAFVFGGAGPDTLSATRRCYVSGGIGDDRLVGGMGPQSLSGGAGSDSLDGGPGDDELQGDAGTDVIAGGLGDDFVSYIDHTAPVRISLDDRANDGAAGEADWVRADVEDAIGSKGPTNFIGNAGPNTFVSVSDEGDLVRAGAGDDEVGACCFAGDGPNVVWGGPGDDQLEGGKRRNVLLGGAGDDVISGRGRADVIRGGPGGDLLNGQSGADDLRGGRGRDRLSGGSQNDILRGGPARDHLLGNSGADVFYARDRNRDRVDGGAGIDRARIDFIDRLFSVEVLF